jgi:WD40 repeat protein/transcriptional regulator with XRE-family HTH domain
MTSQSFSPNSFQTFGDLLKYLRRRERLTQLELSIAVGYSETQITRLEKNQRRPELSVIKALFIPALHIQNEPEITARFLELAEDMRQENAPVPGLPPYKGLLFFDESDAELFFGRETLISHLADRVSGLVSDSSTRLLAIVGASGSGKSSLVRAGLATTLKKRGWDVRTFTPGESPQKALEKHLDTRQAKEEPDRILVIVDQFEEVFTSTREESERATFIENLLFLAQEPNGKHSIVIALRADFYPHCAHYPALRHAVAAQQEYIGQMTAQELRRAIEEPAKHGGWEFEPGLIDVLMNDIGASGSNEPEPGALPLLSHALLATWERRRGKTFTLDGYRSSGGVHSAIAETAESVFTDQLNQQQQELARDVFLRLTKLGEGTEDTRRRATLNELVRQSSEAAQLRGILNTLAEARLITLNEDSAEVAHEALIREWQRLHGWLTQDREGLRLYRHITESAREWETMKRDSSELYRGARLAQAREWAATNYGRLNESERAFLAASIEHEYQAELEREVQRQRELEMAQKLAETEKRSAIRLRQRAIYLTLALGLAMLLAGMAAYYGKASNQNAKIAFVRELSASAVNNLSVDPERSILLSLQAVNISKQNNMPVLIEAEDALHRSIQASRVRTTLHGHTGEIMGLAISPDEMRMATFSDDGTVKIWDAQSNRELLTISSGVESQNFVRFINFSSDGKFLVTPAGNSLAKTWDVATGREILTLRGHQDEVIAALFSPDGKLIATASMDKTIKLWNAKTGEELNTLRGHKEGITTMAFSPDGSRLYTGSDGDGFAIAWNVSTGELLFKFSGQSKAFGVDGIAVSPDGKHVATGEFDTTVRIWDSSGNLLHVLYGHASYIDDVAFSPDGKYLASASEDGTAKLWEVETGKLILTLSGHTSGVVGARFSKDGKQIITISRDKTIKIWDISPVGGNDLLNLVGHTDRVYDVAYNPDGTQIATSSFDNTVKVWNSASGKELLTIAIETPVNGGSVSYSPDGKQLIFASGNQAKMMDTKSGKIVSALSPFNTLIADISYSPDGTKIAAASQDGIVRIYDSATAKILIEFNANPGGIEQIAFSPDGGHLAIANDNGDIIYDTATGKIILTLAGHGDGIRSSGIAFSPDGKRIATTGNDATVKIWNSETGAELFSLTGHTGPTFGVLFSPDGTYLASSSVDRTIKIWTLPKQGEQVDAPLTLYGNGGAVYRLAFSPDGTRIVATGRDHVVRIYELNTEGLIAIAKSRLTRTWTLEECQKYLHMEACPTEP